MNTTLIDWGRLTIPRPVRRAATTGYTRLALWRVALAQALMPRGCYAQILPNRLRVGPELPAVHRQIEEYRHSASLAHRTLIADGARVLVLRNLLDHVRDLPNGNYAEIGTWFGYTARQIYPAMAPASTLYCFDTFEGFHSHDRDESARLDAQAARRGSLRNTLAVDARKTILGDRPDEMRLVIRRGAFPSSFDGLEDTKWRFVHLDFDFYEPTLAALELFWEGLVPGGAIVMHDYESYFTGVKRAAAAFFGPRGLTPIVMPDKAGTGVVVKPGAPVSS